MVTHFEPTMLILLETRSVSWAESVRLALLADGVEAVVLDQHSPGTLGLMGTLRVAIANDFDLNRAAQIVADLQPPKTEPVPSWWWHKRALLLLGMGFVSVNAGRWLADSTSMRTVALVLTIAGAVVIAGGFTFLFLGYRADSRRITEQSKLEG